MGRIPDEDIQRLKRDISLEQLVRSRGIDLRRTGANLLGLCPFHDDHEPSLVITPDSNLWHCLGACQAGGSVIDFVMKAEGVSFRHAVELLRRGADLAESGQPKPVVKGLHRRKLEPLAGQEASDAELLGQVADHYHASLLESDDAQRYLRGRGLEHADLAATFRLGFANRTLGYRLPASQLKAGQLLRTRLARLGVLRATGHEHLRGSLVVPLLGTEGEVVQLYGRKIDDHIAPDVPRHLYLPGAQRGVFNRAGLAGAEEAILCEALIDALTFWCAGYHAVTSGYGVEGVTEEILDALEAAGVVRVKIAFDRDEAGGSGRVQGVGAAERARIESYRVVFPRGMDANAYAQKLGPAAQSLGLVLRQAEWMRGGRSKAKQTPSSPSVAPFPSLVASSSEPPAVAPPVLEPSEVQNEVPASALPAPATTSHDAATPTPAPTVERNGEDLFLVFGGPQVARARGGQVERERAEGQPLGVGRAPRWRVLRRHGGSLRRTPARALRQERHGRAGRGRARAAARGRRGGARGRGRAARRGGAGLDAARPGRCDDGGRARRGARALARSKALRAHRRGPRPCRHRGRRDEQARLLPRRHQPQARGAPRGRDPKLERGRQVEPDGGGARADPGGGARPVLGDDRTEPLLHERQKPQAQDLGHRGGGGCRARQLRPQAAPERGGADHCVDGQGPVDGPPRHPDVPGRRPGDDRADHHCERGGRGAAQPLSGADGRRGREQTRLIHDRQRRAQTLAGLLERDDRQHLRRLHRNAQRLLQPVFVVNPSHPTSTSPATSRARVAIT
ncbi:MAG: toprim domain-containing protein [Polyangiaceae bacterium]|nr:toprim domain-containing protein [Polyangiaceae bacterium]